MEFRKNNKEKYENYNFLRRYGITLDQYNEMLMRQNYKCAICGRDNKTMKKRLHVDHDHKTKEVRGLLCYKCNSAIGLVDENISILDAMKMYLTKYKTA